MHILEEARRARKAASPQNLLAAAICSSSWRQSGHPSRCSASSACCASESTSSSESRKRLWSHLHSFGREAMENSRI